MKKTFFISIVTLAALAMPMFSSCSSDDDNTTLKASDIENPSPLDDAVKALYKSTWYWVGYAEDGEYTQVGTGEGDPLYRVSFSEGRMDGAAPTAGFYADDVIISGNKIHFKYIWCERGCCTDPKWSKYLNMIRQINSFNIREDGLLQLYVTEDSYLLFSTTHSENPFAQ